MLTGTVPCPGKSGEVILHDVFWRGVEKHLFTPETKMTVPDSITIDPRLVKPGAYGSYIRKLVKGYSQEQG